MIRPCAVCGKIGRGKKEAKSTGEVISYPMPADRVVLIAAEIKNQ